MSETRDDGVGEASSAAPAEGDAVTLPRERVRALENAARRLENVLEIARIGSWELDLRTRTATWSDETYAILGVDRDKPAAPRSLLEVAHPDDRAHISAELQRVQAGKARYDIGYRVRVDGRIRHIHSLGDIERDASGAPLRIIGIVQDVTEAHALRAQLFHAQKLETVGRLAAGLAHDLNNLLMVIQGACEFLDDTLIPGSPERGDVATIADASRRAASLTRSLLAFSRQQVLQPRRILAGDAVEELRRLLPRLLGEEIEVVLEPGPPLPLIADPQQLNQVLINLAVNARDAMPEGGRLRIGVRPARLPDDLAAEETGSDRGFACFEVEDTGLGMDADTQSRIFEPFFTTKGPLEGTGLGLSTAYGIVAQSGGYIRVESAPGAGARFEIFLPLAEGDPTTDHAAPAPVQPAANEGARILVVDDDDDVRNVIVRGLERSGFTAVSARGPKEALTLLHAGVPFDLVLADVMMPEMSGRELVDAIVERRPGTIALYMSGYAGDPRVDEKGPRLGDAFLAKPFSPGALAARIHELLDEASES